MRDPTVVFIVAGAAIFALDTVWSPPLPEHDRITTDVHAREIRVTSAIRADQVAVLAQSLERAPTEAEIDQALHEWVDTEILVREAYAAGLHRDDPLVRQRLAQKMAHLLSIKQAPALPGETQLQAYWETHRDRYVVVGYITLDQVFLNEPDGGPSALALAAELNGAGPDFDWSNVGQAAPGGPVLRGRTPARLTELYGEEFSRVAQGASLGQWTATRGDAGWHVIRVRERIEARPLAFEEARDRVLVDWQTERVTAETEAAVEALRAQYEVIW